jgi:hypothetical protein
MSTYVSAVTPSLNFFKGAIKIKNQHVLHVVQKRFRRYSQYSVSPLEESLFLLQHKRAVLPADIRTVVAVDKV